MGPTVRRTTGRPPAVQVDRGDRPTARAWYSISNRAATKDATNRCAKISLFDEIGMWGTTAADFAAELAGLDDIDEIELHVNSPGGDVFDGLTIYNALTAHPATVTVHVDGLAASAASFIAQAGDRVVMSRGSMMMIHDAAGFAWGPASELRSMADLLDKISDQIAGIYAARSGSDAAGWRKAMLAETWYTDTEAVAAGLADETADSEDTDADATNRAAAWIKTRFQGAPPMARTRTVSTGTPVPKVRDDAITPGSDAETTPDTETAETPVTDAEDTPRDTGTSNEACTCVCDACTSEDCDACTDQCEECDTSGCPCLDDEQEDDGEEEGTGGDADEVEDTTATPIPAPTVPATDETTSRRPHHTTTADPWADLIAHLVGPASPQSADDVLASLREALA
ncbi:MAG: hypothetical protein QG597_2596 [Actinomycetota bacterium]|nr:hypothetical protein [Actinomycetota bacterium]